MDGGGWRVEVGGFLDHGSVMRSKRVCGQIDGWRVGGGGWGGGDWEGGGGGGGGGSGVAHLLGILGKTFLRGAHVLRC